MKDEINNGAIKAKCDLFHLENEKGFKLCFDTKEEVASYPPELKAALVDIHYIAEQLEHEFQNSERFALYASPKKR